MLLGVVPSEAPQSVVHLRGHPLVREPEPSDVPPRGTSKLLCTGVRRGERRSSPTKHAARLNGHTLPLTTTTTPPLMSQPGYDLALGGLVISTALACFFVGLLFAQVSVSGDGVRVPPRRARADKVASRRLEYIQRFGRTDVMAFKVRWSCYPTRRGRQKSSRAPRFRWSSFSCSCCPPWLSWRPLATAVGPNCGR